MSKQCSMVSLLGTEQKVQQVQRCQKLNSLAKENLFVPHQHHKKPPNKQTLDLRGLLDFCSIACLVAHTEWGRNARLVLCCLTIKLLFPSWASTRTVQQGLFWLSEERLGALLGDFTWSPHTSAEEEDNLILYRKKPSCRIIFQCPSRNSKSSPKGFPLAGYKSTCLILVCRSHFTVVLRNCSEKIISSNKSKNLLLSFFL